MTSEERRILRIEFQNLDVEDMDHFAGGCRKSKQVKEYCAGFNNTGKVGKYHHKCRHYASCQGEHLQYNP